MFRHKDIKMIVLRALRKKARALERLLLSAHIICVPFCPPSISRLDNDATQSYLCQRRAKVKVRAERTSCCLSLLKEARVRGPPRSGAPAARGPRAAARLSHAVQERVADFVSGPTHSRCSVLLRWAGIHAAQRPSGIRDNGASIQNTANTDDVSGQSKKLLRAVRQRFCTFMQR